MRGKYYWCVLVADGISDKGDIYLYADAVEIHSGDLLFRNGEEDFPVFAMAIGMWKGFYAASCIDGAALVVEHWIGRQSKKGGIDV